MQTTKLFLSLLFLIVTHVAAAQSGNFGGLRVYHENDFLTPFSKSDDNYTGGLRAEFIGNVLNPVMNGKLVNPLRWNPLYQSFSFTVTAFTPTHLERTFIDYTDRPYASYRSWNFGAGFFSSDSNQRYAWELSLGALGRPLAGKAQTHIHEKHWFGSTRPVPQGWDYQVGYNGAFAANIHIDYSRRIFKNSKSNKVPQLVWMHELNGGQYMINYMQGIRIYLLHINNDVMLGESVPSIVQFFGARPKKFGLNIFVTPRLKAVLHNATLTGSGIGKESVYTVKASDMNRILAEYEAGASLRFLFIRLGYNILGRSREYKFEYKKFHHWGGPFAGLIFSW